MTLRKEGEEGFWNIWYGSQRVSALVNMFFDEVLCGLPTDRGAQHKFKFSMLGRWESFIWSLRNCFAISLLQVCLKQEESLPDDHWHHDRSFLGRRKAEWKVESNLKFGLGGHGDNFYIKFSMTQRLIGPFPTSRPLCQPELNLWNFCLWK